MMDKYVFLFAIILITSLAAQIPRTISYQGILTDPAGNPKPDGNYSITFNLYENETGGDAIWTESKTLNVSKGLFFTLLGDQTHFGSNVKFDNPYFLGIKVGDETELLPRIALTSAGFSFSSIYSDTTKNIVDGKVVKSINGLKDNVKLIGNGGTAITTNGDTITITSSSGDTGIQEIRNTDGTINITNPNGSQTTLNLKVPLLLYGTITAHTESGTGISGSSSSGKGVYGQGTQNGVIGITSAAFHVFNTAAGVYGESKNGAGVFGVSEKYGLLGIGLGTNGAGIYASANTNFAGNFEGDVNITGTLFKGGGAFRIDHPLDPANKYLSHSFVESPDMKNIYDGVATTDANGNASITLPDWFEVLNKDFRYQLTVVGQFAQAIIENKIQNNQFSIKTDKPNVEVSWQVTGIRKDAFAEKNRIKVEEFKNEKERGKYLHPELFGQQKEMGIHYVELSEIKEPQMVLPEIPGMKEMQK